MDSYKDDHIASILQSDTRTTVKNRNFGTIGNWLLGVVGGGFNMFTGSKTSPLASAVVRNISSNKPVDQLKKGFYAMFHDYI